MSARDNSKETAVKKAKAAGQQALGKLIGDDEACARADARLSKEDSETGDAESGPTAPRP